MPHGDQNTMSIPESQAVHEFTTKMSAPTLMTISLELRLKIFESALPQEIVADCCTCNNKIDGRPIQIPGRPRLPLLMVSKQVYREMQRVLVPIVVAELCDVECLCKWLHAPKRNRTKKLRMIRAVRLTPTINMGRHARLFHSFSTVAHTGLLGVNLRTNTIPTNLRRQITEEVQSELVTQCLTATQHYFRRTSLVSALWQPMVFYFEELHLQFHVGDVIA